jgi:protein TonB
MYCILYSVGFERWIMSALASEGARSGIRRNPLSCWWKIPDRDITVVLNMQVIERINEEIKKAAVQSVSNNEIGGLLLGTITSDPTLQVTATECFPVPCSHELGPFHRLSYTDRRKVWQRINRHKETRGELQYFVSYYRSNLGPDFQLTSSDLELVRDFVQDPFFFLLIQPLYPKNIGGLFFLGEEPAQPERRILFPFDKNRLLSGDTILKDFPKSATSDSPAIADGAISTESSLGEISDAESYSAADFVRSSLLPSLAAQEYRRKSIRKTWLWISLGGFLVLTLIGILYMSMKPKVAIVPRNAPNPVAIEANAPPTLNSESLTESAKIPSLNLANEGRPQPQNPVVSAPPRPAIGLRPPPPAVAAQNRPLPKEIAKINNATTPPAQISTVGVSQSLSSQAIAVAPQPKPKPQPAAAAEFPSQNQPSLQPKEALATRSPQISTFPSAASSEPNSGANASLPESKPVPAAERSADSVPTSIPSAKPRENLESPDAFIPPRPIEAPNPVILPSSLRSQMPESMQVDIRVYVDATGAVIGAKSLYDNAQIARLVVDAVRRMRFTPARRGNQYIASDLILKLKLVTAEPR